MLSSTQDKGCWSSCPTAFVLFLIAASGLDRLNQRRGSSMPREKFKQTLSISIVTDKKHFLLMPFKISAYELCGRRDSDRQILFNISAHRLWGRGISTTSLLFKR